VHLILFDLDGTLIDHEGAAAFRAERRYGRVTAGACGSGRELPITGTIYGCQRPAEPPAANTVGPTLRTDSEGSGGLAFIRVSGSEQDPAGIDECATRCRSCPAAEGRENPRPPQ